jgi:hypothetical protein
MTNVKALEIWTAQTICDIGILLSVVSFLLHIGRPYFERILGRLTLRVAGDLWWLIYLVLRDATLFVAVLFGFWSLNLDLMADIKIALPFVPFGTVALAGALWLKAFGNAEDLNRRYRAVAALVCIGTLLNTVGYVLVMEAPGGEYRVASHPFWQTMVSLRSNMNPDLATATFYSAGVVLLVIGVMASIRGLRLVSGANRQNV